MSESETSTIDQLPFGQMLVAKGIASEEEVDLAVQLQTQLAGRGIFLRLGELLVARGVIDEATVGQVLEMQGTTILVCQQCMAQYNVLVYSKSRSYRCSRCREVLALPEELREVSVEDTLVHSELELDAVEFGAGREFGNYVILGQISRGGMGIIYKARQRDLDRVVAMKVMAMSDGNQDAKLAFNREARAVAALRHPFIVAVHEVGQLGGVEFYTMDYVEGLPFQSAVTSEGLDQREIAEVFVKICDAVDYSHSQGLLHRDIKPQNILLDSKHNPTLIDFGIAAKLGESDADANKIIGSPAYLPPEYISGEHNYDVLGEVYAIGATLYAVLAGRPPHTGIDTVQLLRRATVERIVPLRRMRPGIDRELAAIVMTCLDRDARKRYVSAQEIRNDLRRWLDGDEVAGGHSPLGRAWQRVRGKVAAAFGLAVALMLLTVSVGDMLTIKEHRKGEAGLTSQFERERRALREQLVEVRMENSRLMLEAGRAVEAEDLVTRLLREQGLQLELQGRLHALRARARDARGDLIGAAEDREDAKRLGTSSGS